MTDTPAKGRNLELKVRGEGEHKPLGTIGGSDKADVTTDKNDGSIKFHYKPHPRYFNGKEKPGDLIDEVDIVTKPGKTGGNPEKVVPFDKTGDKKAPTIKIKIAPLVRLRELKNPFVTKPGQEGGTDGTAAVVIPEIEKHDQEIRSLFAAGGKLLVKPVLVVENVNGKKLTSTKLIRDSFLFAGKEGEHKLELGPEKFKPESGYEITIQNPDRDAKGGKAGPTVTLPGEIKVSDVIADKLRAIVLAANGLDKELKVGMSEKANQFCIACLDYIADKPAADLEKKKTEFIEFLSAVESYLRMLEIVALTFGRTLKLHGLAYRRYMENGINFAMELLFHLLDKEARQLMWDAFTQPRATILKGLRTLKLSPLVHVADDMAKAFKKQVQDAGEKIAQQGKHVDELLEARKVPVQAMESAARKTAAEGVALKEAKEGVEKLGKELDELENVRKPMVKEALDEAEKRAKDLEEGLTSSRGKLKGLEDQEKPLEKALKELEDGTDGLKVRKQKKVDADKHLSETSDTLKTHTENAKSLKKTGERLKGEIAEHTEQQIKPAQRAVLQAKNEADQTVKEIASKRSELVTQTGKKNGLDGELAKLKDVTLKQAEQAEQAAKKAHQEVVEQLRKEADELASAKPAKQALDDQVEGLTRKQIPDAEKLAGDLQKELDSLPGRIAQARAELVKQTAEKNALEIERLQAEIRRLVASEAGTKQQLDTARRGLVNMRVELREKTRQSLELGKKIGALDQSVPRLQQEVPRKLKEHSLARLEVTKTQGLITQKAIQSKDLDAPIKTLQDSIKGLVEVTEPQKKAALESARGTLEGAQGKLKTLNTDLSQAATAAEEAGAGVKAFTDAQKVARQGVVDAEKGVAEVEGKIVKTSQDLGKIAQDKQDVGKVIDDLESKQPGTKSALDGAKKESDDVAKEIEQKGKSKEELAEKARKLETEIPKLLEEFQKARTAVQESLAKYTEAVAEKTASERRKVAMENMARQADEVLEEARKTGSAQDVEALRAKINQSAAQWNANQAREMEAVVAKALADLDKALNELEQYLVIKDLPAPVMSELDKVKFELRKHVELAKKTIRERGIQLEPSVSETIEDQLKVKLQEYQDTVNKFVQEKEARGKPKLPTYTDDWWGTVDWFVDGVKGVFSTIFGKLWEWGSSFASWTHETAQAWLPTWLYDGIASVFGFLITLLVALVKGVAYFITWIGDTIIENASGEGPLSKALHSWVTEPQREQGKSFLLQNGLPPTFFDVDQEKNKAVAKLFHAQNIVNRFGPQDSPRAIESTLIQEVGGAYKDYYTAQQEGASSCLVSLGAMALSPTWFAKDTLPGGWSKVAEDNFLDKVLTELAEYQEAFESAGDSRSFTAGLQRVWNKTRSWTAHDYDYMLDWLGWLIAWTIRFAALILGIGSVAASLTGAGIGVGLAAGATAATLVTASGVVDVMFAFVRIVIVGLFTMQNSIYLQHDMIISAGTSYLTIFKEAPAKP